MKFLVLLLLVVAVIALTVDDKNQREALVNVSQERDQAQVDVQSANQQRDQAQKEIQRLTELTQHIPAPLPAGTPAPPGWFQQRLQQKPALDAPQPSTY